MQGGGHRSRHRSLRGRVWAAAAPRVAPAPSPGGCHRPARSRTGSAADMGAVRSSGAGGSKHTQMSLHKKIHAVGMKGMKL